MGMLRCLISVFCCSSVLLVGCHAPQPSATESYELALQVAQAAQKSGNVPIAVHAYEEAMAAQPRKLEPVLGLGQMWADWQKYSVAVSVYQKAMPRFSSQQQALLKRRIAVTYMEQGQLDRASGILAGLVAANPRCDACWDDLGTVFAMAGYEPLAERCYKKGLQANPSNQHIAHNLWHMVNRKEKGPYLTLSQQNIIQLNELCDSSAVTTSG